jgi:large subunit ribosomal protein L10
MEARAKKLKAEIVDGVRDVFLRYSSVIFFDFTGMDVPSFSLLRSQVRKSGGFVRVMKNSLIERVFQGLYNIDELLEGPTALALMDDPISLAKVLNENLPSADMIKGGIVQGRILSRKEVISLSKAPSYEELIRRLVGLIISPIMKLSISLKYPVSSFGFALKAFADKGEEK